MTAPRRAFVELTAALLVAAVAVWSALNVSSTGEVAPIMDGQPATTSVTYNPPLLMLALFCTAVAGVLVVVAVARWRRASRQR